MALRKKKNIIIKKRSDQLLLTKKLTKELLRIVHYNLQTSIRWSLFSKDFEVEQSFNFSGSLFSKSSRIWLDNRIAVNIT